TCLSLIILHFSLQEKYKMKSFLKAVSAKNPGCPASDSDYNRDLRFSEYPAIFRQMWRFLSEISGSFPGYLPALWISTHNDTILRMDCKRQVFRVLSPSYRNQYR